MSTAPKEKSELPDDGSIEIECPTCGALCLTVGDGYEPVENPPCPVHADQRHGKEAEELRAGIEDLLKRYEEHNGDETLTETLEAYEGLRGDLQALLDDVDARDSLAFLEKKKPKRACAAVPRRGTDR